MFSGRKYDELGSSCLGPSFALVYILHSRPIIFPNLLFTSSHSLVFHYLPISDFTVVKEWGRVLSHSGLRTDGGRKIGFLSGHSPVRPDSKGKCLLLWFRVTNSLPVLPCRPSIVQWVSGTRVGELSRKRSGDGRDQVGSRTWKPVPIRVTHVQTWFRDTIRDPSFSFHWSPGRTSSGVCVPTPNRVPTDRRHRQLHTRPHPHPPKTLSKWLLVD